MSLDGYIAGPNGEADWIIMDPEIDFRALFEQFDTFLLGSRTFEGMGGAGGGQSGAQTIVFSRTLRQQDYPNVTIVSDNPEQRWPISGRTWARTSGYLAEVRSSAVSWKLDSWIPSRSL
jgi:dihydrofolate reductase